MRYRKNNSGEELTDYKPTGQRGSISSQNIRSLLEDSFGNLWIGTDKGLNLLVKEEQDEMQPHFIVFKHDENDPSSISHDYILPMYQSKDSTVWIGTMGGGLNKVIYDKDPSKIRFEAHHSLDLNCRFALQAHCELLCRWM